MTISAAAGARVFIGTTAIPVIGPDYIDADVLLEFEADSYIEVGEVEDLGEFGDESEEIPFTSLADSRVRKLKGPRDAGSIPIVVGDDVLDDGQAAMEAAERTPLDYNFKIILNDAQTLGGSNSAHYFYGKVMSKRRNVGQANNVIRRTFNVGINSPIISTDPS
jgi:hypothetical protein